MKLVQDYKQCERIVKQHSSSFYRAFSILPEPKRNAVWAVYAFCRTVDDMVDENVGQAAPLLDQFAAEFEALLAGRPDRHPYWQALHDVFQRYKMDPAPFRDMIRGQRQDLIKFRYESLEELEQYCYLVAGTVGLMLLPILAPEAAPRLKESAVKLGIAMQITNILRDVAEDYERGRLYLPSDLMEQCGFAESSLGQGVQAKGWQRLFGHLTMRAEQLYAEGLAMQLYYPRDSRTPLAAAAAIYRQILIEAKKRGGDVFSERIRVSGFKKLVLIGRLLIQPTTWRETKAGFGSGGSRLSC